VGGLGFRAALDNSAGHDKLILLYLSGLLIVHGGIFELEPGPRRLGAHLIGPGVFIYLLSRSGGRPRSLSRARGPRSPALHLGRQGAPRGHPSCRVDARWPHVEFPHHLLEHGEVVLGEVGGRAEGSWRAPTCGDGLGVPLIRAVTTRGGSSGSDNREHITRASGANGAIDVSTHSGADVKPGQRMLGHTSAAMRLCVFGYLLHDDVGNVAGALNSARIDSRSSEQVQNAALNIEKVCHSAGCPWHSQGGTGGI